MTRSGETARRLRAEGLRPTSWGNEPLAGYAVHSHDYDKVIVVDAGAIRFALPTLGTAIDLAVGDRLELPAGTPHGAAVGAEGVSCLEAHLPAGTLAQARRLAEGDW